MSKRKAADPFIAPRCLPDLKENTPTEKWDMELVITRLDGIQDSIDQILNILLSGPPSDESEDSNSDKQ